MGVSFDMERFLQIPTSRTDSPTRTLVRHQPLFIAALSSLLFLVQNLPKSCDTVICLGSHTKELLRLRLELVSIGVGVDTSYDLPSVRNEAHSSR